MQKQQNKYSQNNSSYNDEGLGTKKTIFVLCVVVGCIGILWPKLFYPMIFGNTSPPLPQNRGSVRKLGKCCEVVLDKEVFFNSSLAPLSFGTDLFRRHDKMYQEELSLRQERPPHLRDGLHPAMRERGRAIPDTQTIPIVERQKYQLPKVLDGRPGPVPGMRPPMGSGNMKSQQKPHTGSMGIIMPIYTVVIVIFFIYTISKLVTKKTDPNAPYDSVEPNLEFRKEVFGKETLPKGDKIKLGLIDAVDQQEKDKTLSKSTCTSDKHSGVENLDVGKTPKHEQKLSNEKSVKVLGMELSASWDHNASKWTGRPPTPIFVSHFEHSTLDNKDIPAPESIYLEGSLPSESQILITDAETHTEETTDKELNGSLGEPAIILSSKMTLSLINLDKVHSSNELQNKKLTSDVDSPLSDDIELIGDDEKCIS